MLEDSACIIVENIIANVGAWDIELAPWGITMLAPEGVLIAPQNKTSTGTLPNRAFSFWDYSAMNDERIYFGKDYITMCHNKEIKKPFKFGYNNLSGISAYINHGQALIKSFEPVDGGYYPDNGCCFEVFANESMLESEFLGELQVIPPDEEVVLVEEWEIFPNKHIKNPRDEAEISKIMESCGVI
jgi:hypothetical protein